MVSATKTTELAYKRSRRRPLTTAFLDEVFPCNPIPFAAGLTELVRMEGSDSIQSDEAKAILWILMAQAYGQSAKIDLADEWSRLAKIAG